MGSFVYSCHRAKISSGELVRLTGIIEAYMDQSGSIALTEQNHRLFEYKDQRITAEQRQAIRRADRKTFWALRKQVGDPIADVALPILNNSGINGRVANLLTGLSNDPIKLNQLGVDLMIEHANAVSNDYRNCSGNVPGLLNPEQVAKYHHDVFLKHGIGSNLLGSDGSWLFGGTLFNLPASLYRPIWCRACDFTGPQVGATQED